MHVDDFIDNFFGKDKYPRFFFLLHRLPAVLKLDFSEWIRKYKLFCIYKGKKYRVTGCSRLGDIWLSEDMNREEGYELRVDVDKCSDWSET